MTPSDKRVTFLALVTIFTLHTTRTALSNQNTSRRGRALPANKPCFQPLSPAAGGTKKKGSRFTNLDVCDAESAATVVMRVRVSQSQSQSPVKEAFTIHPSHSTLHQSRMWGTIRSQLSNPSLRSTLHWYSKSGPNYSPHTVTGEGLPKSDKKRMKGEMKDLVKFLFVSFRSLLFVIILLYTYLLYYTIHIQYYSLYSVLLRFAALSDS